MEGNNKSTDIIYITNELSSENDLKENATPFMKNTNKKRTKLHTINSKI